METFILIVAGVNKFSGEIPLSIAALPRLMEIDMGYNKLEGHVGPFLQSESLRLIHLCKLKSQFVSRNEQST